MTRPRKLPFLRRFLARHSGSADGAELTAVTSLIARLEAEEEAAHPRRGRRRKLSVVRNEPDLSGKAAAQ